MIWTDVSARGTAILNDNAHRVESSRGGGDPSPRPTALWCRWDLCLLTPCKKQRPVKNPPCDFLQYKRNLKKGVAAAGEGGAATYSIPFNYRLSNKHCRNVEMQRTTYMQVGHSLVSWQHHWRPDCTGGLWNLMCGHRIDCFVRNIKIIGASLSIGEDACFTCFSPRAPKPSEGEEPPQGRLLQLRASNSLCYTKFRRAPRQVLKGLQPPLGQEVQRAKQTG